MNNFTVSKLAERVGSTPSALRYYERIGLLPEPKRSAGGYRLYDDEAADRVLFIKRAQRFGLRLDEISELLGIRESGMCPCGHTRELLESRLTEIDHEMASLASLRSDIARMIEEFPSGDERSGWGCGGELVSISPRSAEHRTTNEEGDQR